MGGFFIAVVVVAFVGLIGWLFFRAVEDEDWRYWLGLGAALAIGLGLVINAANEDAAQGPCLREETGYMMSGKVMVPYTYCVERGTWVDE